MHDVLLLCTSRIQAIRQSEHPRSQVLSHDQLVATGPYSRLDPGAVAEQLTGAAAELGAALAQLRGAVWSRNGHRDGEERTVLETAQRAAHKPRHHQRDIAGGLAALASPARPARPG